MSAGRIVAQGCGAAIAVGALAFGVLAFNGQTQTSAMHVVAISPSTCLLADQGGSTPMCLDTSHDDHLQLRRLHAGDCVLVTYAGTAIAANVQTVAQVDCGPTASASPR